VLERQAEDIDGLGSSAHDHPGERRDRECGSFIAEGLLERSRNDDFPGAGAHTADPQSN
jgi:hypothetical protein